MARLGLFARINNAMNRVILPLTGSPRSRWVLDPFVAVITYTGRRSGRRFSTPVFYRRRGDQVVIRVAQADQKNWWRNFEGAGGPISVNLRRVDRAGHATAVRDQRGRTTVTVELDKPSQ